jgi:hypothetical protein
MIHMLVLSFPSNYMCFIFIFSFISKDHDQDEDGKVYWFRIKFVGETIFCFIFLKIMTNMKKAEISPF